MASRSYDRVDFYRRNRDYSSLLEDGVLEDKEEEVDDKSRKYRKSAAEEDSRAKRERQDFIERKEKLKELERIKLNQKYNGVYGMKTEHIKNENQIGRYAENISGNDKKRKMPHDNYGSFFGPSKPVIARRVIEEAQARIEKAHVAPKVSKEAPQPKKSSMTTTNTKAEHKKKPVIINETTKKARQLKAARDYSFLFSEDAEIPCSERGQASETKNITSSRPNNVQAKQMIANNSIIKKPPLSSKPISQIKEVKSMGSSSRQMTNKLDTHKKSVDSRKQLTKVVSSGQLSRGNGSNHHSEANVKTVGSATVSSDRKKLPLNSGSRVIKAEHRQSLVKPEQRSSVSHLTSGQKTFPLKVPTPRPQADQRKSVALPKSVPPKPAPKLVPKPALKLVPKSAPKLVPKSAPKPAPKPALKPVPKMAPKVQAKPPSRDLHHERPKKRSRDYVSDEDIDEGTNFRSLIRQMFRYDPNKYRDIDDDDSDMEVGFSRIQAEERRSARIAREEDERELALIEAEEREERAKAKRRKLQQNQR